MKLNCSSISTLFIKRYHKVSLQKRVPKNTNYEDSVLALMLWPTIYETSTTAKKIHTLNRKPQIKVNKTRTSMIVFRILFQSIVQNLGGLKSSLAPLYRDPGVSFGQMISEFLKEKQ